jgi:hypothetical protein
MYEGDGELRGKVFDGRRCGQHYHDRNDSGEIDNNNMNDERKPLV